MGPAGEKGGEKGLLIACSLTLLPSSCKDTNDYVGPTRIMFPSQGPQINYICKTESGVLVKTSSLELNLWHLKPVLGDLVAPITQDRVELDTGSWD